MDITVVYICAGAFAVICVILACYGDNLDVEPPHDYW